MSFQSKGFWMPKDAACLPDGDMAYDNSSRMEPKRPHQWFMDGAEAELFPNKKQAVDIPSNNSFSGMPNTSLSHWVNVPGFHSVPSHFTERLLDPETTRAINFDERSFPSITPGNLNMGRKSIDDPLFNDASFALSISHTLEDPRANLNYGGVRKVKVSQVKDSENMLSVPLGPAGASVANAMPMPDDFNKVNDGCTVSMPLAYSRGEESVITTGDSFSGEADTFISMNQPCNRGDNTLSMGHNYKGDSNTMLLANPFSKVDDSLLSAGQSFSKGDSNIISISQAFTKGDNNMISMSQNYNNMNGKSISLGHNYNKGVDTPISICHSNNKVDSSSLSIAHAFEKGESNIISFGSFNDDDDANASGRLICNYDLLMAQPSVPSSDSLSHKGLVAADGNMLPSTSIITVPGADGGSRKKDDQKSSKKAPANNFPSNVRSLLSTGILDGVPVKYIAWSREKELPAIIRGSGYLCGCKSCNMSKVINAYEFERHADCKTKHPNNHIYFENGKTIYGIVQELRSTPQNMLFDVIQTITGSPINQKSFRLWKESFLAATRELQRIYGKD